MDNCEIPGQKGTENKSDFLPHFLPLSDLKDPPPKDCDNRNDQIRWEFLSVYYELNRTYAKLLAANSDPASPEQIPFEQRLEELKQIRDRLEDHYAPYGVIAEASFEKGFAVNVTFTFPDESRWFQDLKRTTSPWEAELRVQADRDSRSDS